MKRVHAVLTLVWVALIVPSVTIWKESVPWLVGISVYANLATHWDAWQTSKAAEERDP